MNNRKTRQKSRRRGLRLFLLSLLFAALLSSAILAAMTVVQRKESRYKYADFFGAAKTGSIDVLLLGSSHVINGIDPVQLYEDYGITSYNMGGHGSMLPSTYWTLRNALDYCTPRYVVIDTYMLEKDFRCLDDAANDGDPSTSVEQLHLNMDAFPVTATKIAALNDLIASPDTRRSFLFDFEIYHNRWEELNADDFRRLSGTDDRNSRMGAEIRSGVDISSEAPAPVDPSLRFDAPTVGEDYLNRMLDLCSERGITPILTYLPFAYAQEKDFRAAHETAYIAARRGIPFLDLIETDGLIDYGTDMNDRGHLNRSGMYKVTAFIGTCLRSGTDLADRRGDPSCSLWEQEAARSDTEQEEKELDPDSLYSELLDLYGTKNASWLITFPAGSELLHDPEAMRLLSQLGTPSAVQQAAASGGPYFLMHDGTSGKTYEWSGPAQPEPFDTLLGSVTYIGAPDFQAVYLDGREDNNLLDMEEHYSSDLQLLLFDNADSSVLTHLCFEAKGLDYEMAQAD
ncbi:MAG: hypothetical protein LKJ76_05790 [Lachnospiraceae bacterium]|nr:hypothetical protein [Lachnospiraceae bacterium]